MTYREGLIDSARSALCGWMSVQAQLNRLGQDALAGLTRAFTGGVITPVRLPNPAAYWYRLLCNREPPPPPPPPFTGGQCDGVEYSVFIESTRYTSGCSPASNGTGSVTVWGPVLAVRFIPEDPLPGNKRQRIFITCRGSGGTSPGPIQDVDAGARQNLTSNSDCPAPEIVDIQVSRVDGLPDDCGDPPEFIPIPFPRPRPIIVVPQFTWIDNDNNIQIQPDFRIRIDRPSITLAPNFNIPVSVDLGNPGGAAPDTFAPTFNLGFNFDGSVTVNIGGDTNFPLPDPDDDLPVPEPIPIPDPDPEKSPDPKLVRILYAAIVTARQTGPTNTTSVQLLNSPTIIAPDAGKLNFLYEIGKSRSYGPPNRIMHGKQIIYAENEFLAIDAEVDGRPGWEINVSKLYRDIDEKLLMDLGYKKRDDS